MFIASIFNKRRLVGPALGAALAASALISVAASAQTAVTDRFKSYAGDTHPAVVTKPLALRGSEHVDVVVTFSGDSIAAVRGRAADHRISDSERALVRQSVAAQHAAAEPSIQALGGKVLARMHGAINGIKVDIERRHAAALAAVPGAVQVLPVAKYHLLNTTSVPFIGAPAAWQGTPGYRGENVKIAVIDTGIDYTHADFGGPGTPAAFTAAAAASTAAADPALFGPNAPKVKGGIDLVGDAYNADVPGSTPVPDPNPLDCEGHGTHVSGTAAGFGVDANGNTYAGPYDAAAYTAQNFKVGPGVAPKADLYAVRVFGCAGSTNVVTEAIDWAVRNNMDVISMSLGSDFGTADTADALAASAATQAGVIVAAASGNAGPAPYITSTPASGDGVISVAATDAHAVYAGALLNTGAATIQAQDSNDAPISSATLPIYVLRDAAGGVSLGCNEAEYVDSAIAGKLVVTLRGVCARVQRAQFGQAHGAAAVAMINVGPGYPPEEFAIPGVTIPFLGILESDTAALTGATTVAMSPDSLANPGYRMAASFSSGGPRFGDSAFKPGITAPGVAVASAAIGSGSDAIHESGTSMATPHVAGVAALATQAHAEWNTTQLTAAILESADPAQLADFAPRLEGSGLTQAAGAVNTQAVALGQNGNAALSFGFAEFTQDLHATQRLHVINNGDSPLRFDVSVAPAAGSPHTLSLTRSQIRVGPRDSADLAATLTVPAATVGATHDAYGNDAYREVAGVVRLTPTSAGANGGVALTVPYYLAPRARANVVPQLTSNLSLRHPASSVRLSNRGGAIAGNADFYAWGLTNDSAQGVRFFGVRAAGVQTNPISASDSILVFALNTFSRFSSAAAAEFDVLIDTNGDGVPDYDLVGIDYGLLSAGSASGEVVAALLNIGTGKWTINFLADVPTDGSTVLLPVLASDLGLSPAQPKFSYAVQFYNLLDGSGGAMPGAAPFNAFAPAISNALFVPLAPGSSATVPVAIDRTQWASTPAMGLMVVTTDNFSGPPQAHLLSVGH
jgi:minor extracellular serine protease Vpr